MTCAEPARTAGRTPEAAQKRANSRHKLWLEGKWSALKGEANPRWRGGRNAYLERQAAKDPEIRRAQRRAYLKANPEKKREWALRRRGRGRLPKGSVNRIGELQRWRCPVCATDIKDAYHLDHIVPLAKGGLHEPKNVQLLCPSCNVRKSAKHPIDFMQSRGFLL